MLTTEQLQQQLETFAEFRFDPESEVTPVVPVSDNLDPRKGVRNNGRFPPERWIGQLGLTQSEIDKIADRLGKLLERIDAQEIELFL